MALTFPNQLDRVKANAFAQVDKLTRVASQFADALADNGVVHVYANGHSKIAVQEWIVRMGALAGFHPLMVPGLVSFESVIGTHGIRVNQRIEHTEGLGAKILDEIDVGAKDVFVAISATGTTQAAVDAALEFSKRYPDNPLVAIACLEQARDAAPKHSSGKTLFHVIEEARSGTFLDNGMPYGDLTTKVEGQKRSYMVAPLSSIGALTIVQCLNELTIQELDVRGLVHPVLQNMHLANTEDNYGEWLRDQRRRFARTINHPSPLKPKS